MSGSLTAKSRSFKDFQGRFRYTEDAKTKPWITEGGAVVNMGAQVTESEGHARDRSGQYREGGPFISSRVEKDFPTTTTQLSGPSPYGTGLCQCSLGTPMEESQLPTELRALNPKRFKEEHSSSLTADGATAINLCAPTNPNAELGIALSELYKERLPSLPGVRTWKRRTEIALAAAEDFLNAEFGWLPLVKDITDTATSVTQASQILKQYHEDSGKNVRREFSFPVDESSSFVELGLAKPSTAIGGFTGFPGFINNANGFGPMNLVQTKTVKSRRWFSGSFTYLAPSQSDSWGGMVGAASDANKLFGISLTPDIVWELTPWSWAVDWFTNAGDVISNVNHFVLQGLIMRYGYMMEETTIEINHSFSDKPFSARGWPTVPPSTYKCTLKRRVGANAFGFGVTPSSLSTTQVAIAAALGILLL